MIKEVLTSTMHFEMLEPNLLRGEVLVNSITDEDTIAENAKAREFIAGNKRILYLIDMKRINKTSMQSQMKVAKMATKKQFVAIAGLYKGAKSLVLLEQGKKLISEVPVRLFDDEQKALQWLKRSREN